MIRNAEKKHLVMLDNSDGVIEKSWKKWQKKMQLKIILVGMFKKTSNIFSITKVINISTFKVSNFLSMFSRQCKKKKQQKKKKKRILFI